MYKKLWLIVLLFLVQIVFATLLIYIETDWQWVGVVHGVCFDLSFVCLYLICDHAKVKRIYPYLLALIGIMLIQPMLLIGRLVEGKNVQGVSLLWWLQAWTIDGRIIGPLWMAGAVIVAVLEFKRISEQEKRSA